ncbi:MAG: hypothetical protein H8D87_14825 [Deltaproteobacteria bacterium]|uniref:FFLEELY motif protein n=1 Tax=Desulfobacula sp. TaxID=2593537 RepID=UPI00199DD8D3|nr:hypothetical protein [Candidatus Desulfobacula maris]MBL6993312.1 hypothetical protein [Desulfobacula sp.]
MDSDVTSTDNFLKLKRILQDFQSRRINRTYKDIEADPEFAKIGNFFFKKLYAPEDFSFRDTSMKKLHKALDGKVYKNMLTAVTKVIELHDISDEQDNLMVERMIEAGVDDSMTMEQYQKIYVSLDNYDQRIYQINLSAEVTRIFHGLSKKWIVAVSLRTVKTTAFMFGIKEIIDFIYDGYVSFKTIDNIDFFVDTMVQRELSWHNEIWATITGKTV